MYTAQLTIERVQSEIKRKKKVQKQILQECGLSENTLKKMTDKNGIASFSLARIADRLDCSVDYLLGRTENPESHKSAKVVYGDLSNNSGIVGNVGSTITATVQSGQAEVLIKLFNNLDPIKQAQLVVYADELIKK